MLRLSWQHCQVIAHAGVPQWTFKYRSARYGAIDIHFCGASAVEIHCHMDGKNTGLARIETNSELPQGA